METPTTATQKEPALESISNEFKKVITDFIKDIATTFPEYTPLISKWWKEESSFADITDEEERSKAFVEQREKSFVFIHRFCVKKYPPRFFSILNEDSSIFCEDADVSTEFLPFIHFNNIWDDSVSEGTKKTIWKYLQLILFSVVGDVKEKSGFGDTAQMFENMDEDDFKEKLNSALDDIKGIFEQNQKSDGGDEQQNTPNADDIHNHLNGMFSGKLGDLAREIAEETAADMDLDVEGASDVNDVFNKMFKNPGKLMNLVQNVGGRLDEKMKNGDISQTELMKEASEMMNKMQSMPGMGDIQSMMSKMGMNIPNGKVDVKGMEQRMKQQMRVEKMRERIRKDAAKKQQQQQNSDIVTGEQKYTDEELIQMMSSEANATRESAPKASKGKKKKKKKQQT